MKKIIAIAFIFLSFNSISQEKLSFLNTNPSIIEFNNKTNSEKNYKTKSADTLEIPFWDDFSQTEIFPNQNLWTDFNVYINSNYADQMPSLGIATFDAVDSAGAVYQNADYLTSFVADKLTSKPLNLEYPGDNTIFLSFFYKPQGLADEPEPNDSLILQFYAPLQKKWQTVWFANGTQNKDFNVEIKQINDTAFLHKGFKFRFLNYASLGSSSYPDQAANCDFWHIDYIYLNKNRNANDTVMKDIAFSKPLKSILSKYQSMPWSHFKEMTEKPYKENFISEYTNNDKNIRLIDSINFYCEDLSQLQAIQTIEAGAYNVPPLTVSEIYVPNLFYFNENSEKFNDFKISGKIITSSTDSTRNNTAEFIQKFRDYYAYDDETAEEGYGIYGSGTKYGSVAYKFFPEKADNLKGIQIYFTQTFLNASQKYFWLRVWKQNSEGFPEAEPVVSIEGQLPEYEDQINKFHFYEFEQPLALNDTFFIGWTQTTEDNLNAGFDLNTDASNNLFYNISGQWVNSQIEGALMMRPVFGEIYQTAETIEADDIILFPNPAGKYVSISIPAEVFIFDVSGKMLITDTNFDKDYIDISQLDNGIYIVKIISNKKLFSKKLIVYK